MKNSHDIRKLARASATELTLNSADIPVTAHTHMPSNPRSMVYSPPAIPGRVNPQCLTRYCRTLAKSH